VKSKTENRKTFEGSSRALKGKITTEDDNTSSKEKEIHWAKEP